VQDATVRFRAEGPSAPGRTVQFATRVTPDFDEQFRAIAERDRLLHVELLEKALSAYERSRHLGQG
jgi:hypothetical protein